MTIDDTPDRIDKLIREIRYLPSDPPVAKRQPGYNDYLT